MSLRIVTSPPSRAWKHDGGCASRARTAQSRIRLWCFRKKVEQRDPSDGPQDDASAKPPNRSSRRNPVRFLCADLAIADSLTFRDVSGGFDPAAVKIHDALRYYARLSYLFRIYLDNLFRQSPDDSFSGSSSSDFLGAGLGLAIFAGMSKA